MIETKVSSEGRLLYRTSSTTRIWDSCTIHRLTADDHRLINSHGPHFSLFLPGALFSRALRRQPASFEAAGTGTIGQISMAGGAAARDGWEAYEVASLSATSDASQSGLHFRVSVEAGAPDPATFSREPEALAGRLYEIDALIPFENLGDFFYEHRSKPDWWALVRRDVETYFGVAIPAERTRDNG